MKLAFSSNAFRRHTLPEVARVLRRIGYDGMEIMCDRPHAWPPDLTAAKVASIRRAIRKERLDISNLNAFMMCAIGDFHHPSWIEADPRLRRRRVDHTIACVELAAELGAATISTEPGGPIPEGWSRKKAYDVFREGLGRAAEVAEKRGVRILIEPEPELLIESSKQFREFMATVDSPAVGLNFDMGHFHVVGEEIPDLIRSFASQIAHIHLEDIKGRVHHHLPPGEGEIDFRAVFGALKKVGYEGWVTVELYPFQADPQAVARRAYEAIRPLMG